MRYLKMKFFGITVLLLAAYSFIFYLLLDAWFAFKTRPIITTSVVLPFIVVHVDLKGSPPKLGYLESLLPMLKSHGVNGLLMEYEDMFPYGGNVANLSAKNCYEKSKLQEFVIKAVHLGFEIIPLIQTFGHLEYALKLQEYQHLREIPMYPDSICPSKVESHALIRDMLGQVIKFHNSISQLKYIHIGCDEVYHINKCNKCINRNLSSIDIFVAHIMAVTGIVTDLSPGTTILIWDDMLRTIKPKEWNVMDKFKNIEPVYWDYKSSLKVTHLNMLKYHNKFENIWIASAFKGADGRVAAIPNLKDRFFNHFSWLNFILDYKFGGEHQVFNFKGIILTGWSRYSHMDPPCELLPVSIPSLILNLLLIKRFKSEIVMTNIKNRLCPEDFFINFRDFELNYSLQCDNVNLNINDNVFCTFEGHKLYRILKEYSRIDKYIQNVFNNETSGLSSIQYYSKQNYLNMNTVTENIKWCKSNIKKLFQVKVKLHDAMSQYYKTDFIQEYVNFKTYDGMKKLNETLKILSSYLKVHTWKSRTAKIV